MRIFGLLLFFILIMAFPVQADFFLSFDSQLSALYEEESIFSPQFTIEGGCDLYSFISKSVSLFFDTQGELTFLPVTQILTGELATSADISYRLGIFLLRFGFSSELEGKIGSDIYFDLVPELYLSLGGMDFTIFLEQQLFTTPFEQEIYDYQCRLGITVAQNTILHKPSAGLGVDFTDPDSPLYLIIGYNLDWYASAFVILTADTGLYYYFSEDQYWNGFWQLYLIWTLENGVSFTFNFSGDLRNSLAVSQTEVELQPEVIMELDISDDAFISFSIGADIFATRSFYDDPSHLFGSIMFTYVF